MIEKESEIKVDNNQNLELLNKAHLAQKLIKKYNNSLTKNQRKKNKILKKLLGNIEDNVGITPPFYVNFGSNIYIGKNTGINMNCTFLDDDKIIIGKNVLIAPDVKIYTAFHPTKTSERFAITNPDGTFKHCKIQTKPVIIGDNVWIGGGTIILPGITIGDNVVIGAGSVVTKNIPANKVAYGNPCKIIRNND